MNAVTDLPSRNNTLRERVDELSSILAAGATIDVELLAAQEPLFSRRTLVLFGAIAILWTVLMWYVVERQLHARIAESVVQQTNEIRRATVVIGTTVDRAFNRIQGMAAVLAGVSDVKTVLASFDSGAKPSSLPYESRKAEWSPRADLLALSQQLRTATEDIGVDIVWVMNAGGDCVAASNAEEAMSFVGTNYADRDYFSSAQAGKRGRQYAVGRVTKVPGLFFSAPVIVDGRFLGALAVKSDLRRIASAITHPSAFVTDDQGVIILAADHSLEMRALPGAAVHRLSPQKRLSRYMRLEFDTYDIGSGAEPGGLVRAAGSSYPHIATRSELPQHGITVHIFMPMKDIDSVRRSALVTFVLLSFSGIILTMLVFGARAYLLRIHQYRTSIEAKNESLARLNDQLEDLATIDPLTGLYNRRLMDGLLEREVARAQRKQAPLAMIMIDIDHFKRLNDTAGHAGGDAVLRAVGALMKQHVRGSDVLCRYGGEEFLIAMPDAPLEVARKRAEALRLAMHELNISHEGNALGRITMSLGLAMLPQHGASAAALVSAADAAMYEAKKRGRDRLMVCDDVHVTAMP